MTPTAHTRSGERRAYAGPERRRPGRPWARRPVIAAASGPRRRVASGAATRIGHRRGRAHALVGALGWLALAGLWAWQLAVFVPASWLGGLRLIGAVAVLFAVVTPAWVAWNRSIYRRRHRRTTPVLCAVDFSRDSRGRAIEASPAVLAGPDEISIRLDDGGNTKRYEVVRVPSVSSPSAGLRPRGEASGASTEVGS